MSVSPEALPVEGGDRLRQAFLDALGGRYELRRRMGKGAYGEVYEAWDTMLDREVAIKRVRLDAFADDEHREDARKRIRREAKVVARLKHPNIVTLYDIVDTPTMSFIVMEFVEGTTLEKILDESERLSLERTVDILAQTADALDYAHRNKVVHRDVKPANIMIEPSGRVKVTDFGIAKAETMGNLTATGSILGTPNYMSPEQARGETKLDGRSDIFSLGCILQECLTGRKAFPGSNVIATVMRIVNGEPEPVDFEALGLAPTLAEVLRRALAKDREERFRSAAELVEALRAATATAPSPEARPEAPAATADEPVTEETTERGAGRPEPPAPAPAETASKPEPAKREPAVPPPPASAVEAPVITRRGPDRPSSFDAELQGSLEDTSLAEIIRKIYAGRRTGILHLERDGVGKRLYFQKGSIIFANSDVEEDRLGEFLIAKGIITRAVFQRASGVMKETGQRFGKTLVELGVLDEEGMNAAVVEQIQAIVQSVFAWDRGAYAFEKLEKPVEEDIVLSISTGDAILEGVRRMESFDRIRAALGDPNRVLRHSENPLLLYQKVNLTPSEGFVLSRVDGAATVADIAAISPLGEEETLRCIYGLLAAGVLELGEEPGTERPSARKTAEEAPASPSDPASPPPVDVPAPDIGAAPSPPASAAETRKAKADAGPSAEELAFAEEIAAKHASLATATHYELLEVPVTASAAEIKKAFYGMVKKYHPDRHHSPHLKPVEGLLEELFVKISSAYETLSDAEARRRYDESLRPKATPGAAAAPAATAQSTAASAPSAADPGEMARKLYGEGKRAFYEMAFYDAIQALREAVRLDPSRAEYHKLLAMALAKNPHWRKDAEESFKAALKLDASDVECYLGLAEIYDVSSLKTRARKMYEKVLELDPENEVAAEKLGKKPSRLGFGLRRVLGRK